MKRILVPVWRRLSGALQWRALWLLHDKFNIGVNGVLLNERREVLLLRHTFRNPHSWGLPSGQAKSGERAEMALAREILEETGYEAQVDTLIGLSSGFKLRLGLTFAGRIAGGALRLDKNEVLEARFFGLTALPKGLLASDENIIKGFASNPAAGIRLQ